MNCLNCGNRISDWQVLKSVSQGYIQCEKCSERHRVAQRGMGLSWLVPLMGVIAAIVLAVLFWIVEVNAVVQAVVVLAAIVAVAKLSIKLGVQLSLYSKS